MRLGFFTRQEAKSGLGKATKTGVSNTQLKLFGIEHMRKLGLDGVKDMNPAAQYPLMEPSGSEKPNIYMLLDYPTLEDDKVGRHAQGPSGRLLRKSFSAAEKRIRWNYVVRTRPAGTKPPTVAQIEGFRNTLIEDIEASKPKVVVAVGSLAVQWALPKIGQIEMLRGRRFPVQIGSHRCWLHPIYPPAQVLRAQDKKKGEVSGKEFMNIFHADNSQIMSSSYARATAPEIMEGPFDEGVVLAKTIKEVRRCLAELEAEPVVAFDLETTCLRPYAAGAEILTIALAGPDLTVAIPIDHPQNPFTAKEKAEVKDLLWDWLLNKSRKLAHNAAFEIEWLTWWFGPDATRAAQWEDSLVQAYVLDSRPGGKGLDFLSRYHFGFSLKSLTDVSFADLRSTPLDKLLYYNALDSKWTLPIYKKQAAKIKEEGLSRIYEEHIRRLPTAVQSQAVGLEVAVDRVADFQQEYTHKIADLIAQIADRPEVRVYEREHGSFNPASTNQLVVIFRDILKRPEGQKGKKYSTDKKALGAMVDVPLADLVLKLRTLAKLKSTYIDNLHPDTKNSATYPDGRLHPLFKTTSTVTGRWSSEAPNGQNFPKRNSPEIRSQIIAGKGNTMVSIDYGQIEARVIAMASKDSFLMKALWDDYDIHMEWAQRVAKLWPRTLADRGGDMKKFRSDIKNELTFPLFYGSTANSVARMLQLPERIGLQLFDEFWDTFPDVKKWQLKLRKDYKTKGYVETLTGRRRYAPMSTNMIINTPVQGTASDIVVDAMNRLSEYADEKMKPWYQPVLNIHDDLTFVIPDKHLDVSLERIIKMMLVCGYSWAKGCPIEIDVSMGPDWFRLTDYGKFRSQKLN